jgi:nitroreductase
MAYQNLKEVIVDYESLLELVERRRSIRRFKPDPIPEDYVDRIIQVARWAPSGFNTQPWEFVVVREKNLKDDIVQLTREHSRNGARMEATREPRLGKSWRTLTSEEMDYSTAPVFILLFGDTRTKMGLPMGLRSDPLRSYVIFISSLANAFLYMHLAATTLGLATQWISGVKAPLQQCLIKDMLGIPQEMEAYDMMAVGYPAVRARPKLMRDMKKMVHRDYCGKEDFRSDEDVSDFLKRTRTWVIATHQRKPD